MTALSAAAAIASLGLPAVASAFVTVCLYVLVLGLALFGLLTAVNRIAGAFGRRKPPGVPFGPMRVYAQVGDDTLAMVGGHDLEGEIERLLKEHGRG